MAMDPKDLSSVGKKFFHLIEFDENEQLVSEIRKHRFGLLLIFLVGLFIALAVLAVTIAVAVFLKNDTLQTGVTANPAANAAVVVVGLVLVVLVVIMTFIAALIYHNGVVFVTSEKIVQVLYLSILNRKISQLSIGDVQDVTVKQVGLFPRVFNYGTLVIETAGEQQNYTFTFTPNPYEASKAIVGAHERDRSLHGN